MRSRPHPWHPTSLVFTITLTKCKHRGDGHHWIGYITVEPQSSFLRKIPHTPPSVFCAAIQSVSSHSRTTTNCTSPQALVASTTKVTAPLLICPIPQSPTLQRVRAPAFFFSSAFSPKNVRVLNLFANLPMCTPHKQTSSDNHNTPHIKMVRRKKSSTSGFEPG